MADETTPTPEVETSRAVKAAIGLRSFAFGLAALIAVESALLVVVWKVKDAAVLTALAPMVAGFFGAVGGIVVAVIVKHSVESLATGGGIGGVWKSLTTSAKPGGEEQPK